VHLLLTDRLSCPRCGPEFGLILLSHAMHDRVVTEGVLGCPNCRDSFPVHEGFGDLRAPPRGEPAAGFAGAPGTVADEVEAAHRVIALLGVARGPGTLALVGEPSRYADALVAAVPDVHVVAVDPDLRHWPKAAGVSRMMSSPALPIFSRSLRGVAVDGRLGRVWIADAARVVAPLSRVVVTHASEGVAAELVERGLQVLAQDGETVVAVRS